MVGENPLEEVLTAWNVVEAAFLLYRQQRQPAYQRCGEQSASATRARTAKNRDTLQPTAWRILLQYVATEIGTRQIVEPAFGIFAHCHSIILAAAVADHPYVIAYAIAAAFEPQRFARHPKPEFNFRAYRDEFDKPSQRFSHKGVALMPTVVAHLVSKQTR